MTHEPKTASTLFGDSVLERVSRKKGEKINPRGDVYRTFMLTVNPSRKALGYPLLTESRMGWMTKGVSTDDLIAFLYECEKSKDFVAKFNGMFFPKKIKV